MPPAVSVVMPVGSRERYLREAVNSILDQAYTDFELILIDDGNGPVIRKILTEYADADRRVQLYHLPCNMGIGAGRNAGIKLARGRYLAWMDSDDVAMPERLGRQVDFLDANPEIELCCSDVIKLLRDGRRVRMDFPERDGQIKAFLWLVHGGAILTPTAMMRVDFLRQNRLYYGSQFARDSDHIHFIEMMKAGARFYCLKEPLLLYRRHGDNITTDQTGTDKEKTAVRMLLLPEFFPGLTGAEGKALLKMMGRYVTASYIDACQGVAAAYKAMHETRSYYGEDRSTLNKLLVNLIEHVRNMMMRGTRQNHGV